MKNIKNNLPRNKFLIWVLLPLFMAIFWIGLTALYIIHLDTSFSVLSYNEPTSSFTKINYNKLLKGQSISGTFIADDNNLGIVAIKFQTFSRPSFESEDKILFQIREKNAKNWYYKNSYEDRFIYDIPFFPFGFPVIHNSRGKTYEFQITSLNGNVNNSVALAQGTQILATKYKYTKEILLHNKETLFHFIITKIKNAFESINVLFSSFLYLLPLLFYVILIPFQRSFLKHYESVVKEKFFSYIFPQVTTENRAVLFTFDSMLLLCAILDMFVLQIDNDVVYILIPLLWIILHKFYGGTSRLSFLIGIGLLFIPPFFLSFNLSVTAEQITIYAFLFLATSLVLAFPLKDKSE